MIGNGDCEQAKKTTEVALSYLTSVIYQSENFSPLLWSPLFTITK